jgi:hypothetical protein
MTTTKDEIVKSPAKETGFQKKRAIEIVEDLGIIWLIYR